MAAETWLTYNGISLRNVLTKRFEQQSEYDASDTDLACFKFTISVTGYMHAQSANFGTEGPAAQTSGADYLSAVRSKLMSPRGDLKFIVGADGTGANGDVLLEVNGPALRMMHRQDVKNGPKPRTCNITRAVNSSVLEIEYTIEAWVVECRDGTDASPATDVPGRQNVVLSNRWSCVDSIDQNMRTVRTISGLLRTGSSNINPNSLRHMVVPRLQMGFRRDSMTFKVTPDALNLEYTIVDREVACSPPPPATSWNYSANETTADNKISISSIDITLAGPRDVDKGHLVRIAVAIIKARLYDGNFANDNAILHNLSITDSYGDDINSVNVQAQVQRTAAGKQLLGLRTKNIGKPISAADLAGASPNYSRSRSRGNYPGDPVEIEGPIPLTSAWNAFLQSHCNDDHYINNAVKSGSQGMGLSNRVDYQLAASITTDVTNPTDRTSSAHKYQPYTHYELESKYQNSVNNVALPVAGQRYAAGPATPSLSVVGLALPNTTRTIRISAQRYAQQPKLPKPAEEYTFGTGKAVLLRNVVTPKVPDVSADGKELHTVLAEFTYALTVPPPVNSTLPIGVNPWEDPAFATHITDPILLSGANP